MKFKKDYISAYKELKLICSPFLETFHFKMFAYSRVFKDGSRAELWTNIEALEHSFIKKKYITDTYTPDIYNEHEKYVFLPDKVKNIQNKEIKIKYEKQLHDQEKIFDNSNCFNIVKKEKDFCEYFIFYTENTLSNPVNFYLSKINTIEDFLNFFKKNTKKIIKTADHNKIILPKILSNKNTLYNNEIKYGLSKKEFEICKYIKLGKTSIEIAGIINISYRTVEKHIERIKIKFGCRKKTELIIKIIELGL